MKIISFVIIGFLLVGAFMIYSARNIDIENNNDRSLFISEFSKWVFRVGGNVVDVTGNAIKTAKTKTWMPNTTTTINHSVNKTN